jgi:Rps23 Pro-64 3,4-dihydroxylase Tpa1-like proline 4-hydroxylase
MLKVYDDLFTPDFIVNTAIEAHNLPWTYTNVANRTQFPPDSVLTKGSHRFFGTIVYDWKNRVDDTPNIFKALLDYLLSNIIEEEVKLHIISTNLQVYGQDGTTHVDDYIGSNKDRTILYYPHCEWKEEWGGALEILNDDGEVIESVLPLPGRVVYMDSSISHRANAPSVKNIGRMSITYRLASE